MVSDEGLANPGTRKCFFLQTALHGNHSAIGNFTDFVYYCTCSGQIFVEGYLSERILRIQDVNETCFFVEHAGQRWTL